MLPVCQMHDQRTWIATPAASDRIANAVNSGVGASRLSASRVSVPIDAERGTAVVGRLEDRLPLCGPIAQLSARLSGIQGVAGSVLWAWRFREDSNLQPSG